MNTKQFFLGLTAILFLSACDPDTNTDKSAGTYDNGVLVVNEGDMVKGTISFIGQDGTVVNDVLAVENTGQGAGSFLQSVFFDDDKAFIISNGSNKITVVDRYTFKHLGSIDAGLAVPRYGVVANGKAFVTNLNTFGSLTDDFVAVIDIDNYEVIQTIPMNALADRILRAGDKIFVGNGNYGSGASLTVVDAGTSEITDVLQTDAGPGAMEVADGILYVLCSSFSEDSSIYKFNSNTGQFIGKIAMDSTLGNAQNLDIEGDKLYFTVNQNVYAADLTATSISDTPLFQSGATSLYGFAVNDGTIYVADSKDFSSNGQVFTYSLNGQLINSYSVGLNPNGFYFN